MTWKTWCVDQDYMSRQLVARVCTMSCSDFGAYCLKKCCHMGNHVSGCGKVRRACKRNYDDRFLFNLSSYIEPLKSERGDIGDVMGIQTGFKCHDNRARKIILNSSLITDRHSLDMNGSLQLYHGLTSEYCLDTFECNGKIEVAASTCILIVPANHSKLIFTLLSISVMFLIITLVVHCSISEFRNLHGFNLISYISSLLLGYLGLARAQYGFIPDINVCTAMGYCIYFGFMSAFMWVNVLCFDIWWKMSHMQSVQRSMNRSSWIKFIKYSLYAWGMSVCFTLTTFLLDIYPLSPILDAEMGKGRCWFGARLIISNQTSNGTTLSSQARSTNISMTSVQTSISNSSVPATSPSTEKKEE
ncbi:unnamed protein product [Diatraea saccharalis]|uniref:G-protein coupled receptor Mth2 n=1 Tax=Diatraea saccharalis TaxID=40085 RepID=A0A9N9QVX3_9NEOP|nr:unnamed protein product [Diatraea saccharalis]